MLVVFGNKDRSVVSGLRSGVAGLAVAVVATLLASGCGGGSGGSGTGTGSGPTSVGAGPGGSGTGAGSGSGGGGVPGGTGSGGTGSGAGSGTTASPSIAVVATASSGSGLVGTLLATPFVVTVTNQNGTPVPGVNVVFSVASGLGAPTPALATTDPQGVARTSIQLPSTPGTTIVWATAAGVAGKAVFTATALPIPTVAFSVQPPSSPLGVRLVPGVAVSVTDPSGNPVAASVTLSLASGSGSLSGSLTQTSGANGIATFRDISVRPAGTYTLRASVPGASATSYAFQTGVEFLPADEIGIIGSSCFAGVRDVVMDPVGHRLFVSDYWNGRVLEYALSSANTLAGTSHCASFAYGEPSLTCVVPRQELYQCRHLAFDAARQRLYVASDMNLNVVVYDTTAPAPGQVPICTLGGNTSFPPTVGNGALRSIVGLTYDPGDGSLYVGDPGNYRVLVFDTNALANGMSPRAVIGAPDTTTSGTGTANYGVVATTALAADPAGHRLFVGDNARVLVFTTPIAANNPDAVAVLGQADFSHTAPPSTPTARGIQVCSGLGFDGANRLYVSDGDDNRVLVFDTSAITFGMSASFVLGQASFSTNAAATTQTGLSQPRGIAATAGSVFVVDDFNSRVLEYDPAALANGMNATDEIGQLFGGTADFHRSSMDDWSPHAKLASLGHLALDSVQHRLFVADTGNNRVLVYPLSATNTLAGTLFEPSIVLGEPDLATTTGGLAADLMTQPVGLAFDAASNRLYVSDQGNNRVLVFDATALQDGMPASHVLGQSTFGTRTTGMTASTLSSPWGLALDPHGRLFVADGTNFRVLVFDVTALANGMSASFVVGRPTFTDTSPVTAGLDRIATAYAVAVDPSTRRLFVVDGDEARVLVFDLTVLSNGMTASVELKGPGATTFGNSFGFPHGIAVDPARQRIYVADGVGRRVLVFDGTALSNGVWATTTIGETQFGTSLGLVDYAQGVAADPTTGNVFVGDYDRILLFPLH